MGESVFWTNTENVLLLNVGHTMSPVRVAKWSLSLLKDKLS